LKTQWPQDGVVRFVVLSDTHSKVPENVPEGDVLLHCGDMTMGGKVSELTKVNDWLGTLPHKTKIAIVGNHDNGLDIDQHEELVK